MSNVYLMDDRPGVDNHDYKLERYGAKLCRNHHAINVMNLDRSYIFVASHKFVEIVDGELIGMLPDRDFSNQHHKNLSESQT